MNKEELMYKLFHGEERKEALAELEKIREQQFKDPANYYGSYEKFWRDKLQINDDLKELTFKWISYVVTDIEKKPEEERDYTTTCNKLKENMRCSYEEAAVLMEIIKENTMEEFMKM